METMMTRLVPVLLIAVSPGAAARRADGGIAPLPPGRSSGLVGARGDTLRVCAIRDREVRLETAADDPAARDTAVASDPSARVYPVAPLPHADSAEWFARRPLFDFQGRRYVWYGFQLAFFPEDVTRWVLSEDDLEISRIEEDSIHGTAWDASATGARMTAVRSGWIRGRGVSKADGCRRYW